MRHSFLQSGLMFGALAGFTVMPIAAAPAAPQHAVKDPGRPMSAAKTVAYSGIETEEDSQTLGDGNRMTRTTEWKVYRDSAGRTRKEIVRDDAEPLRVGDITLSDPQAGITVNLNAADHTERRQVVVREDVAHQYLEVKPQLARRPPPTFEAMKPDVKSESLGEKMIEGYRAVGSRTTVTHPAGSFGYARPIVEVWETWSSPALDAILLNVRDDPRMGKDVVRLVDISTQEPAASLFETPSDYILTEETITHTYPGPPPRKDQ